MAEVQAEQAGSSGHSKYSPSEASALVLTRRRMRSSLVGFAESITIPGAPVEDPYDLEDPDTLEAVDKFGRSEADKVAHDDVGNAVDAWARLRLEERFGERRCSPGYNNIFLPIGYGMAAHHRILCEELQRCMETDYGRLMVFMPPGAAKSTFGSVIAPTWKMGVQPGLQIILASYATPLAKKHGSRARMVVQQELYQGAFKTTVRKDTQAKELWHLTNGSEYMSGGLLSGLTGNRAGGVVIDDPVKGRQAADSKVEQKRTLEAYEDDLKTRTVPKAWVILIQTRWSFEDLAGCILPEKYDGRSGTIECRDGMPWRVLNIPARCEHEDDPLGRQMGEYLWPEWFDDTYWRMYEPRAGDPNSPSARTWASLFQQRPRPESGNMFERDWFRRYKLLGERAY